MITVEPRNRIDFSAWGGESRFSLYCVEPGVRFSDLTRTPKLRGFNDSHGWDFAIILDRQPVSNVLRFPVKTRDVGLWHQRPLTISEWAQGCFQPPHAAHSIAVYGLKQGDYSFLGGKNYRTGKWGHLYRMKALGQWCDWRVEKDCLALTIPDAVVNLGRYPLVAYPIGDTFGYTVQGAEWSGLNNTILGSPDTPSATGTGSSITAWIFQVTGAPALAKCALYVQSSSALLLNGTTDEVSIPDSFDGEQVFPFTVSPTLNTVAYRIVGWSGVLVQMRWDFVAGSWYTGGYTYNSWPDPISQSSFSGRRFSIYCTYTPSGPPPADIPAIPLGFVRGP